MSQTIGFARALSILDKLLEGKTSKDIQFELGVNSTEVTNTKNKFPLFTGLPRPYHKEE